MVKVNLPDAQILSRIVVLYIPLCLGTPASSTLPSSCHVYKLEMMVRMSASVTATDLLDREPVRSLRHFKLYSRPLLRPEGQGNCRRTSTTLHTLQSRWIR